MNGYGSSTYVEDWIRYWSKVGTQFTQRLQESSRAARAGRYGPGRWFSDAVAMWSEGVEAWWGAALGRGGREPAVIMFRLTRDTESKLRTVRVPVPGDGLPDTTDLVRVSGEATIPRRHVKLEVSRLRDEVTIKLIDLGEARLVPGHYLGLVHVDERPIVVVHAVVESAQQG